MKTIELIEKLQSLPCEMMDCEIVFIDRYNETHEISRNVDTIDANPIYDEPSCICSFGK